MLSVQEVQNSLLNNEHMVEFVSLSTEQYLELQSIRLVEFNICPKLRIRE